jgi:hypothetical protein
MAGSAEGRFYPFPLHLTLKGPAEKVPLEGQS